jgi:hypothetical protein
VLVVLLVLPGGLGGLWVRLRDLVVGRLVRSDAAEGDQMGDPAGGQDRTAAGNAPDDQLDDESMVGAG